jgi:hypothetical protein
VAQNTQYDQYVKLKYVECINQQINIGKYHPENIVSMEETNFDFDQQAGETLTNCDNVTIDHCTVLLAVTMSGEKLPPYIFLKGKDTIGSRVWKEFSILELRSRNGYPEEVFYEVQTKAWMDEKRFLYWTKIVCKPFTEWSTASKHGL